MLALYNLLPLYCPSCGTPTRLDRVDNPLAGKFKAKQVVSCAICGIMGSGQIGGEEGKIVVGKVTSTPR